jgi:hypothetical protein
MLLQAVLVPEPKGDRRSSERQVVNQRSTLRGDSRVACDVYVRDLSPTGFSVTTDGTLAMGSIVSIGLPGYGQADAQVVHRIVGGYGCEFLQPLGMEAVQRAFRDNPVVPFTSDERFLAPVAEPVIARWPGAVRVGTIIGLSAALWAGIAMGIAAIF